MIDCVPKERFSISHPQKDSSLLTLPHAAETLAISKRTLERLIAKGSFPPPVKIGRASRVPREDIARFLEQLRRERGDKIGPS
jgi:excisionase family DNA binding protein